jgi:dipeptidyl aminopeptidase/acylaminoacyl peptidase
MRRIGMAALAVMVLATGTPALAANWKLQDIFRINGIGQAQLSPDGQSVAYVRGGQIVVMPAAGGESHAVTHIAAGREGLVWAPDGAAIAYARAGNICVLAIAPGQETCLTKSGTPDAHLWGDHGPQWSPTGSFILFERGGIKQSGQIMSVPAAGGDAVAVVKSDTNDIRPRLSPDGKTVAYTEITDEQFSGKLKLVAVDPQTGRPKGAPRLIYTQPTDKGGWWQLRRVAWSPDSKTLALVLPTAGWDHVNLIAVAGGKPKPLTSGQYEDSDPVFSPDGKAIAVVSNQDEPERRDIWLVALDGSKHRLVPAEGPGSDAGPQWSPDGQKILYTRQTGTDVSNVFVAPTAGAQAPLQLTDALPKALKDGLVAPRRVTYASRDGLPISALVYEPRDGAKTHPAILWIHGGPEEQVTYELSAWQVWAQYLAQQGYVVMMPNFRGGIGRGEKFRNLNVEDSGGGELDDVMAGAQALIASGATTPSQIAIAGMSHGGTMVGYAVTQHPDVFKAAIVIAGVWDRASYLGGTYPHSVVRWRIKMGGTPAQKPQVYAKANSLAHADKIAAPILFFHGEIDPTVPPEESKQITDALRRLGKPFYYYTYTGEYHGLAKRPNREDMFKKQLLFLKTNIAPQLPLEGVPPDVLVPGEKAHIAADGAGAD